MRRLNEIGMLRNVGGSQIELLERPSVGKQVTPNMTLTLFIGACAGLGLGLGLASWSASRRKQIAASRAETPRMRQPAIGVAANGSGGIQV